MSRLKIMANLDISKRQILQEGRIDRQFQGQSVRFMVKILPSRYGETATLYIIRDHHEIPPKLDLLISSATTLAVVREMLNRPFGLMLFVGPTGSGKSTTLYSAFMERNGPGIRAIAIEDDLFFYSHLPGVVKMCINQAGLDVTTLIKVCPQHDPDVVMVHQLSDRESIEAILKIARLGHLTLSTLYANDPIDAIIRILHMDLDPYLLTDALIGIVGQRLLRKVCSECRIPYQSSQEELARWGYSSDATENATYYQARVLSPEECEAARYRYQLCPKCEGRGYKGRAAVYELLRTSRQIAQLISQRASYEVIRAAAQEEGMETFQAYGLGLVRQGVTTLAELERILR